MQYTVTGKGTLFEIFLACFSNENPSVTKTTKHRVKKNYFMIYSALFRVLQFLTNSYHEKVVHAVREVVHHDPVQVVRVAREP
jgi:hypothetical protein